MLAKELETARDKTRNFGLKELELNATLKNQKNQLEMTEKSITTLQEELQTVQIKYTQLADNYAYLENDSKDQITKATEHMQGMQTEMAVLRANLQAEFIMTQEESEKGFQKEISLLKTQLQDYQRKTEAREAECHELTNLLDNERAEADAMRLRLTLHASTNPCPQPNTSNMPYPAGSSGSGNDNSIPRLQIPSHIQAAASPMFSEDFGTVSIPSSPINFKSPFYHVCVTLHLLLIFAIF